MRASVRNGVAGNSLFPLAAIFGVQLSEAPAFVAGVSDMAVLHQPRGLGFTLAWRRKQDFLCYLRVRILPGGSPRIAGW